MTIRDNGTVYGRYYRYYAFGETESEQITLNQAYKYTGKPFDSELDLDIYYYGARYYNPHLGRWLAVDPSQGKYPSLSPYAYCANNPMKYIDPDGEDFAIHVYNSPRTKGFGHMELFYQDGNGNWSNYDQGDYGVKIRTSDGPPKGSLLYHTSSEQDKAISISAIQSKSNHDNGSLEYSVECYNCKDATADVINNADIGTKINDGSCLTTPVDVYNDLYNATKDIDPQNQGADASKVIIVVKEYEVVGNEEQYEQ